MLMQEHKMRFKKIIYVGAPLTLASMIPAPAFAEDWYVAGAATLAILSNPDTVIQNAPAPGATLSITNVVEDASWGGQIAVGHRFGPVRFEAEVGRTQTKAKRYVVTAPINNDLPQEGGDRITRLMANAYFDVPIRGSGVRPYFGAGIGEAIVRVRTKASRPFGPPTAPVQLIDDSANGFAWQAIAGLAIPVSAHVMLTGQFRYFDAGTLSGKDTRGESFRTRIRSSNVDLGVRVLF